MKGKLSRGDFYALFDELSNWGRWGPDDERGAVQLLTPKHVVAAAGLVREGRSITMSLPLNTRPGIENPMPADHHMTLLAEPAAAARPVRFIKDYVGLDYHND